MLARTLRLTTIAALATIPPATILPLAVDASASWLTHADLPAPIANNAVTTHTLAGTTFVYTFLGIDSTKVRSGIQTSAARLNTVTNTWETLPNVPLEEGRIAASAVTLGDSIYVIGGYKVASNGQETTSRRVSVFDPATKAWVDDAAIVPVKVDDMIAASWRDTHIVLVSGWSTNHNVRNVQLWERATNTWSQATEIPDFGTFGGHGGICGDHIVFMDGVTDTAALAFDQTNRVLVGTIDPGNPLDVAWSDRGPHPGPGLYRAASWNLPGDDDRILVAGGTDNPYNFDGIGYDGNPSEPLATVWSYYPATDTYVFHEDKPVATMDHRGFPAGGDGRMYVVGGMTAGQTVTPRVSSWLPAAVTAAPFPAGGASAGILVAPNPASTEVRFLVRGGERIERARIHDVAGRVVRSLGDPAADGAAQPEAHTLSWDLRGHSGKRVSAGVYFLRARVGGALVSRPITVLAP